MIIPVTESFDPSRSRPFMSGKFKRRDPSVHFYLPINCPMMKNCADGPCPLSHTQLEVIFHPIKYKSSKCKKVSMGTCSFQGKCSFYHDDSERAHAQIVSAAWEHYWRNWEYQIEAVLTATNKLNSSVAKSLLQLKKQRRRGNPYIKVMNGTNNGTSVSDDTLTSIVRSQPSTAYPSAGSPEFHSPSLSSAWSTGAPSECDRMEESENVSPCLYAGHENGYYFDAAHSESYASRILNLLRTTPPRKI
ncbi:erythrocyte membrane protein [Babesia caballi]|uniref:Erythrocyte membrane protein n=1 Tax=Babesia caballi TaxID=5871 RepID=A0AAV4LS81_BABCB|nr:erythrocyte membrane protein [Babesia caballi]GIX63031.1 erythrocyte membrane protein [Babesia caballi]GIX63032.1 erythrocyte membrane protein [Babesia caballi]GIX63033.1 erythrocyte membrane protein [Babesia caballi]GIX63034.1 erythrocyte membrane protein [Babesia caballi]